jgi:hypothetical protein
MLRLTAFVQVKHYQNAITIRDYARFRRKPRSMNQSPNLGMIII